MASLYRKMTPNSRVTLMFNSLISKEILINHVRNGSGVCQIFYHVIYRTSGTKILLSAVILALVA